MIAVLDGLVLTGGGDVDPAAYGEEPDPEVGGVDPNRDASERALLAAALRGRPARARHLPGLPGPQRRARAARCTSTCPTWSGTSTTARAPFVFGDVDVDDGAGHHGRRRLRRRAPRCAARTTRPSATSGRGLVVTARADDGVIEAVELPGARFVLAVQWHPEEGMDQRPFDALVQAAREYTERTVGPGHGHRSLPPPDRPPCNPR